VKLAMLWASEEVRELTHRLTEETRILRRLLLRLL